MRIPQGEIKEIASVERTSVCADDEGAKIKNGYQHHVRAVLRFGDVGERASNREKAKSRFVGLSGRL